MFFLIWHNCLFIHWMLDTIFFHIQHTETITFFPAYCNLSVMAPERKSSTDMCQSSIDIITDSWSNGSCINTNCTEGTVVLITTVPQFYNYLGSVYLTCIEEGWFPPPPTHERRPLNRK